jgi:hypothetical protein
MACAVPHPFHWEDLRSRTAEQILAHGGVCRAKQGDGYELRFLNAVYHVDPIAERIVEISPSPSRNLREEFQILLIRYLVSEDGGQVDDKEVSEKDFPGGVSFFQGPHALHVSPIARLYGKRPDAFERRSRELDAVSIARGDKAMRFHPFPQIPVTYVLWKEDEEFPASLTVLFDSSITRWFELDMIFILVWVLTERITEGQSAEPRGSGAH